MGARKEADAFVRIWPRKYPAIVLESGWSEPERDLVKDARLWLLAPIRQSNVSSLFDTLRPNSSTTIAQRTRKQNGNLRKQEQRNF